LFDNQCKEKEEKGGYNDETGCGGITAPLRGVNCEKEKVDLHRGPQVAGRSQKGECQSKERNLAKSFF